MPSPSTCLPAASPPARPPCPIRRPPVPVAMFHHGAYPLPISQACPQHACLPFPCPLACRARMPSPPAAIVLPRSMPCPLCPMSCKCRVSHIPLLHRLPFHARFIRLPNLRLHARPFPRLSCLRSIYGSSQRPCIRLAPLPNIMRPPFHRDSMVATSCPPVRLPIMPPHPACPSACPMPPFHHGALPPHDPLAGHAEAWPEWAHHAPLYPCGPHGPSPPPCPIMPLMGPPLAPPSMHLPPMPQQLPAPPPHWLPPPCLPSPPRSMLPVPACRPSPGALMSLPHAIAHMKHFPCHQFPVPAAN